MLVALAAGGRSADEVEHPRPRAVHFADKRAEQRVEVADDSFEERHNVKQLRS
jgi:hypothetical protein